MPKKKEKHELTPRQISELATAHVTPNEPYVSVKHLANLGDVIAIMPALKKYREATGIKLKLLQMIDFPGNYYAGATHPTKSEDGTQVTMNKAMFNMVKPLVESQDYIHSFEAYAGQKVDLDFDIIRTKVFVGLPNLMLQSWIMFAYPDLSTDLSKPWIFLPEKHDHHVRRQVNNKVIINFTERYRSEALDYSFLKKYAPDLIFSGTEREHNIFCGRWGLSIRRLQINDFLEYAYAIKYSKFLMGNQSFGWNIAQAMGEPRLVECCRFAPNVQPFIGSGSYGFFHQIGAEWCFRELYNNT